MQKVFSFMKGVNELKKKLTNLVFTQQRNFMHFGLRGVESNLRDLSQNVSLIEAESIAVHDLFRRTQALLKRITTKEARAKAKKEIL